MKMKAEHFAFLKAAIEPLDIDKHRDAYRAGNYHRAERTNDVNRRYRWDLLHATVGDAWVCSKLYPYLNDNHIDTALRQIVPAL